MANNKKRGKGTSRTRAAIILGVLVLVIAVAACLALNGFGQGTMVRYMKPWAQAIPQGIDLRGGASATYQADKASANGNDFATLLTDTVGRLENRIANKGYTEAKVAKVGTQGIRMEIPGVQEAESMLNLLGKPGALEIQTPDGLTLLTSDAFSAASVEDGGVSFTLTSESATIYEQATTANVGGALLVALDGETIATLPVEAAVTDGKGIIKGETMTAEDASNLAILIQSGTLPLTLTQQDANVFTAEEGTKAANGAVLAGFIGFALIALLLLVRYRLAGVAAILSLIVHALLVVFLLAVFGAQMTIPGLVAFLAGLGIATGANMLFLERFRTELIGGRQLRAAYNTSYRRALSTIVNASFVFVIVAVMLLQFGTSAVNGFAVTLLISALVWVFTSVFVTRLLMSQCIDLNIKNPKCYVG